MIEARSAMDLQLLKRNWEAFGRDDPLWAVLTEPTRKGGQWDPDEFLATGEREIAALFDELEEVGISMARGRALDFGCGAGRLTQALAARFDQCDGVDIAASMVAAAERLNRHGDSVRYHVNASADLTLFAGETFDFALSYIVLQHMEPRYAKRYIAEFVRVLKLGAVAVFSLPTGRSTPAPPPPADATAAGELDLTHMAPSPEDPHAPVMEMYGIRPDEVESVVAAAGGRLERRIPDSSGGPGVEGYRYVVRRITRTVPPLPRPGLGYLEQAIAAVPTRPDRFPPVITRRTGVVGRLELGVRRALGRVLRPLTWVQTEYDREVLEALSAAYEALREQDSELRRLARELERLELGEATKASSENSGDHLSAESR